MTPAMVGHADGLLRLEGPADAEAAGDHDGEAAAGLSVFAAVFFVIPIVVGALPQKITGFAPYLPSNAGGALWGSPLGTAHALSPWAGFAVLCGYAVVLIALAAWRLRSRDA
jgi:hypothetical protein